MSEQRNLDQRGRSVSERDWEIYRQASSGTRTQRELAAVFGLSAPRISSIVARVHQWVEQREWKHESTSSAAERDREFAAACARHIERLEWLFAEAQQAWEESQVCVTLTIKEVKGQPTRETRTIQARPRDPRALAQVQQIACQLEEFRNRPRVRTALAALTVAAPPTPAPTDDAVDGLSGGYNGAIGHHHSVIQPR